MSPRSHCAHDQQATICLQCRQKLRSAQWNHGLPNRKPVHDQIDCHHVEHGFKRRSDCAHRLRARWFGIPRTLNFDDTWNAASRDCHGESGPRRSCPQDAPRGRRLCDPRTTVGQGWRRLCCHSDPNITHAPLALAAISHGVAVVVDKPLAISSEQADQVIKAADDAGVLLTVFQNRRWDGDFLTVKSLWNPGPWGRSPGSSLGSNVGAPRSKTAGARTCHQVTVAACSSTWDLTSSTKRSPSLDPQPPYTPRSIQLDPTPRSTTTYSSRSPITTACAPTCSRARRQPTWSQIQSAGP